MQTLSLAERVLLDRARKAKERAHAPYSRFRVGAALLAADGRVFTGCNIENAAFSPTCCAERVAIFKAVSEGVRDFTAIAVAADKAPCTPCGVCRQVLAEFCRPDLRVILEGEVYTLGDLLPQSFALKEEQS